MVSLSGLLFLVAVLLPSKVAPFFEGLFSRPSRPQNFPLTSSPLQAPGRAFEEKDIQCQDPFDPSNTITVKSSRICDDFEDCLHALDERKDLCGNMHGVQLREDRQHDLSVHISWDVTYDRDESWEDIAEERRAAMLGPRVEPDGYFLTRKSDTDSFTVQWEYSPYIVYSADDLKPCTSYTFFLRPYIYSEENALGYRIGTASTVTVRTRRSAPRNVLTTPLDDTRALISWEAVGYVEYFQVRALEDYGNTLTVEVSDTPTQTYTVLVAAPSPDVRYRVRSCVRSECSDDVEVPSANRDNEVQPVPCITTVAALSDTSFVLQWRVDYDRWIYDRFVVRYCALSLASCQEITVERERSTLTVDNLHPNTTYAIKLHLRLMKPGNGTTLSKPARAVVSTWLSVPLAPLITDKPLLSSSDSVLYTWTLYNSSLRYVQYSLNGEEWHNCSGKSSCAVTYTRPEYPRSFAIEGTMKLWSLRPFTAYTLFARACNDAGCGANASVQHSTKMREPSGPQNLQATSFENGTTLIHWDPPSEPGGPLDGYEVYHDCPGKRSTYIGVTTTEALVSDIHEGVNCTWSVLAYHYTREGHILRGTSSKYRTEDIADRSTSSPP